MLGALRLGSIGFSRVIKLNAREDTRIARAVVRILPHGRELRFTVGDVLMLSKLYRTEEDVRELGVMSTGTLQNFEGRGWTLDPSRKR